MSTTTNCDLGKHDAGNARKAVEGFIIPGGEA